MDNTLELEIRDEEEMIGYASCFFCNDVLQIKALFVRSMYRGKGFEENLLSEVHKYANEKKAKRIIMYCGPEPFCEDGQTPLDEEVKWYKAHGYQHDHNVCGTVPCMIKTL